VREGDQSKLRFYKLKNRDQWGAALGLTMRTIALISSLLAVACSVLAQDLEPCQTRDSKGNLYDLSPLKKTQGYAISSFIAYHHCITLH
jgi:hypothetical protein